MSGVSINRNDCAVYFDEAPAPLWVGDFSEVKRYFDRLRATQVSDLLLYFVERPNELKHCAGLVQVVAVNRAALKFYVVSLGALGQCSDEAKAVLTRFSADDENLAFRETLLALAKGLTEYRHERVLTSTATGVSRYVSISWALVQGFEGSWERLSLSVVPHAEEEELHGRVCQKHLRMKAFFDSLPMAIGFSREGITVDANPAYVRLFGYSSVDEFRGTSILGQIAPQCQADILERIKKRAAGHPLENFYETMGIRKDGTQFPFQITVTRVDLDEGPMTMVAIYDLTEIRHTEEVLRRSQKELARAQAMGHMGSWVRDLKTNEIRLSDENCRIFGLAPGTLANLDTLFTLMHPYDIENVKTELKKALQQGGYSAEYRILRSDGSVVHVHSEAEVVRDADGSPAELVGIVQDVTEWVRQQKEKEEILRLEKIARAEAERANRSKDIFLATLSHELRTPLTVVLAWVQLIRSGRIAGESVNKGLEAIEQGANQQTRLIEDLLDISRIIAGKLSVDIRPVSAIEVIENVVRSLEVTATTKNLKILSELDPEVTIVLADPGRLQQILWNLLGNAIKFSVQNGTISVKLRRTGGRPEIVVSDEGVGMESDFLPHIFDRFSQEENVSTRRYGGLGLGVAIFKHLVELMGGTIQAESGGKGLGSSFTVSLNDH
ncbi:PAS domain S-box protein [Bdellovibrionota bacterium FG-1]